MPTIKNKEILTTTSLFKIEKLDIDFKNNVSRQYEIISGTGSGAVMVIPIINDRIILIKEYAAAIDDYCLSFPKGKIDSGENLIKSANRELQEEIGYKSEKLSHIYTLDLAPGYINHQTHIVLATDLNPSKLDGDEPEDLEIIEWKIDNIDDLFLKNKNIDSRTIACMYIYLHLNRAND